MARKLKKTIKPELEFIIVLCASLFLLIVFYLFKIPSFIFAASASHSVISEVQVGATGLSTNEFVELYNPTDTNINLENWRLSKKTSSGVETDLISTMSGTIPAHGYFLIGSDIYNATATISADLTYLSDNASLSTGNTVLLYSSSSTLVDKVGFGSAQDFETDTETDPAAGTSRERKAKDTSTTATMVIGGLDEFLGNGEDTDNNNADFNGRVLPQPQNSQSLSENLNGQTPTPSASPTNSPSPTVTSSPSSTPVSTVTPSPTPTPTPVPTSSPLPTNPSVVLGIITFPNMQLICKLEYKHIPFGFFHTLFPRFICNKL